MEGGVRAVGGLGTAFGALLGSIIVGLLTPMIARDRPRPVATASLTLHALLAGTGFVLLCVWVAGAQDFFALRAWTASSAAFTFSAGDRPPMVVATLDPGTTTKVTRSLKLWPIC